MQFGLLVESHMLYIRTIIIYIILYISIYLNILYTPVFAIHRDGVYYSY